MSYKDWLDFNNAQRGHYNSLEALPFLTGTVLLVGTKRPIEAAIIGAICAFTRLIYCIGYMKGGPNSRLPGAGIEMLAKFCLLFLSVETCASYFY